MNSIRISTNCICCDSTELLHSPAILMPFISHRVFNWRPVVIDDSWGLNTIKNGTAYSICNTLCCTNCGLIFLDYRFSDSEMSNLYKNYRDDEYVNLREFYEPGYKIRNQIILEGNKYLPLVEEFLKPHLKFPISILDFGGDTGKNTPFRDGENKIDIYEISGIETLPHTNLITKVDALNNKYDLVICSNVLEHVSFPNLVIDELEILMNKDSLLYVELPYEDIMKTGESIEVYLNKRHWHEHINFFSKQSIIEMFKKTRFQVISLETLNVNAGGKNVSLFQILCKLK